MAQRRHHYEQAFEQYLRAERVPYVAVDEAKKALMPEGSPLTVRAAADPGRESSLKSFDFVLYGASDSGRSGDGRASNLLVEVKGRRVASSARGAPGALRSPRLESWVTLEDVRSLRTWAGLFGPEFLAAFVFLYWCEDQPPDALFQEVFEHRGRWYAVRAVTVERYAAAMKTRSPRWGTVHVPGPVFERISQPLLPVIAGVRRLAEGFTGASPFADPGPEWPAMER